MRTKDATFYAFDVSRNIAETPEGFLLCKNVPFARTGTQTYYDGEIPVTPDQNGVITISRNADEVFSAETLSSFEGKPVVVSHPKRDDGYVTPDNWRELAVGTAMNIRRGEGLEQDVCLCDFLITHKPAIDELEDRDYRWEVSAGYDADYVETGKGIGEQRNIRGNHIALVEKGRCGALCAVHDEKGGCCMKKPWYEKFMDSLPEALRKPFRDAAEEVEEEKKEKKGEKEEGKEGTHDVEGFMAGGVFHPIRNSKGYTRKKAGEGRRTVKGMSRRHGLTHNSRDAYEAADIGEVIGDIMSDIEELYDRFEGEDPEEKKEEKGEGKESKDCFGKTKDAFPILQDTLYRSSILAPGLKRPTVDAMTELKSEQAFEDECCKIKRASLDAAYKTADGKAAIFPFIAGHSTSFMDTEKCSCATVDVAFAGASESLKHSRSTALSGLQRSTKDFGGTVQPGDINKKNRDFWETRNKGGK